jgi:predicted GIY-YIG superfamily endonuclease
VATNWTVYLVRCRDGSLYTGITTDLDRRLAAHNAGTASRYTRSRLPVKLVHEELGFTHSLALKREAAIKRLPRCGKLELLAKKPAARTSKRPRRGPRPQTPL